MQWCDFHHCGQYKQSRSLATWFTPATLEQLICFEYCPKATVLGVHIPLQWYWLASAESCGMIQIWNTGAALWVLGKLFFVATAQAIGLLWLLLAIVGASKSKP